MLNTLTFSQKDQIISKCNELFRKGCNRYGINSERFPFTISFDIRGKVAGAASMVSGQMFLRFNAEAIIKHWDEMFTDTVPHEVAHLVTFLTNRAGLTKDKGHGRAWRSMCLYLGGNGKRCYSSDEMQLTKARQTVKHLYRLPSGAEIKIGTIQHRRLHMGKYLALRTKRTGEMILPSHYVGVVR